MGPSAPISCRSFEEEMLVDRLCARFYYGDERKADGSAAFSEISGEAHGELYVQLAEGTAQGPWQQTFVRGVGYRHFPS